VYSNLEDTKQSFESILKSVEYHLLDHDRIMQESMLAHIRVHPAFESFKESNYTELNRDLLT